ESGYEPALMGEFLGSRRRANVRKLVRLARRYDRQGGFTLADFVARLRADLRRPPKEEQAATNDEEGESLRLMTIHQAKGLEFPIVVLPDLDRKLQGERARDAAPRPQVRPRDRGLPRGDARGMASAQGSSHQRASRDRSQVVRPVVAPSPRPSLTRGEGWGEGVGGALTPTLPHRGRG